MTFIFSTLDLVTSDILFALQLRAANKPLLPKLRAFGCRDAISGFIPFIFSFLSCRTAEIDVGFDDSKTATLVMVASLITRFPMLCPGLERITLNFSSRDSVIIEAALEVLLSCNRDTLQCSVWVPH